MCSCVCLYACLYACAYMRAHICAYMRVCMCARTCAYTGAYVCAHMGASIRAYTRACMRAYMMGTSLSDWTKLRVGWSQLHLFPSFIEYNFPATHGSTCQVHTLHVALAYTVAY